MNKLVLIAFFSFILGVTEVYSQNKASKQTIVYDPLFWQQKLRLKGWQRMKINEINADFYGAIIETAKVPSQAPVKDKVDKLLNQRSEKIWSTFSERQKNIWKKLESEYSESI